MHFLLSKPTVPILIWSCEISPGSVLSDIDGRMGSAGGVVQDLSSPAKIAEKDIVLNQQLLRVRGPSVTEEIKRLENAPFTISRGRITTRVRVQVA
jgi:hypothetical protein